MTTYFVSYAFTDTNGQGFGNTVVTTERPVRDETGIRAVERAVNEQFGQTIVLLNLQILDADA